MIFFERISIKNFLSYGNTPTVLDLNTFSKTLICSPNGMGKCLRGSSTIEIKASPFSDATKIQLKDLFDLYWGSSPLLKQYNSNKLKESILVGDLWVLGDGWVPIQAIHKTIPLEVMKLQTKSGLYLEGCPDHPVFHPDGNVILIKDVVVDKDYLITKEGLDLVVSKEVYDFKEEMYDISVTSERPAYFANGILSHNTAIPTALLFGLFGKTHRKVNLPQLVNNINGGECEVEIWFSIGHKDRYHIRRGLKPSFLDVYKNGDSLLGTTITDLQERLEKQILKTDFKTFSSIITIGGKNQIPFMALRKQDRRQIIESLLDIDIFSLMNSIAKSQSSELHDQLKTKREQIGIKEHELSLLKDSIKRAKQLMKDNDQSKQQSIDKYQEKLDILKKEKNEVEIKLKDLQDTFGHIQTLDQTFTSKHKLLESNLATSKKKLDYFIKNRELYTQKDECPTCNQPLTEDYRQQSLRQIQEKVEKIQDQITNTKILISELQQLHSEVKKNLSQFNSLLFQRSQLIQDEEKITSIIQALDKPKNHVIINSLVEDEQKLTSVYEQILLFRKELDVLQEQQEYLDLCQVLLKDDGIKTLIIKEYLPKINTILNQFLDNLDLFIDFNFDEYFNEIIKSRFRELFSYDSFSDGQKMRIDIALLFTWREIAKQRNSLNTNVLFCDELFDSSLDISATELAIKLLDSACKDTCCFVISHKSDLFESKMDRVLQLSLENNFTQIKEIV